MVLFCVWFHFEADFVLNRMQQRVNLECLVLYFCKA
nr:MAG TPA: hypothetical protein [Caudoviricetes sp.]